MVRYFSLRDTAIKGPCLKVLGWYAGKNQSIDNLEFEATVIAGIPKHHATCRPHPFEISKSSPHKLGSNPLPLKFR